MTISLVSNPTITMGPQLTMKQTVPNFQDIHIWEFHLELADVSEADIEILSDRERQRAARLRDTQVRQKWVLGRGYLRRLLASYLGIVPDDVVLGEGKFGKPFLRQECGHGIRFNLTHSDSLMLIAIGFDREVGLDLENMHTFSEMETVARQYFSSLEYQQWQTLPIPDRTPGFYRCWTRKEAYLKARGEGFHRSSTKFSVALLPDDMPQVLWRADDFQEDSSWQFMDLDRKSVV